MNRGIFHEELTAALGGKFVGVRNDGWECSIETERGRYDFTFAESYLSGVEQVSALPIDFEEMASRPAGDYYVNADASHIKFADGHARVTPFFKPRRES